jgi:hypothetical protein
LVLVQLAKLEGLQQVRMEFESAVPDELIIEFTATSKLTYFNKITKFYLLIGK